jgi:hypothetical protein
MSARPFVAEEFSVPRTLTHARFRLEPLGPQHNAPDHAAWSSSIEHIRSTPGWDGSDWPPLEGMSAEENRRDLERHAADFDARRGFTYTVLAPDGDVTGCVYIYPAKDGEHDARVRSWVSAAGADLDAPLYAAVRRWLVERWPFERFEYAERSISS